MTRQTSFITSTTGHHIMGNVEQFWIVGFADIAGSTRLYETIGDRAAKDLIQRIQTDITACIDAAGGIVQEVTGDEVLFRFADALQATQCAIRLQQQSDGVLRISLHAGHLLVDGPRLFGDTVNTAARITSIAQGGQIICSQPFVEQLDDPTALGIRQFDEVRVKGKQRPLRVHELTWCPGEITTILPSRHANEQQQLHLKLLHDDIESIITPEATPFVIGREIGCHLHLPGTAVSRQHASIAFDRGRFILIDTSTNGSYVRPIGLPPVYLRRESMPLAGRGEISVGAPFESKGARVIRYRCRNES